MFLCPSQVVLPQMWEVRCAHRSGKLLPPVSTAMANIVMQSVTTGRCGAEALILWLRLFLVLLISPLLLSYLKTQLRGHLRLWRVPQVS